MMVTDVPVAPERVRSAVDSHEPRLVVGPGGHDTKRRLARRAGRFGTGDIGVSRYGSVDSVAP